MYRIYDNSFGYGSMMSFLGGGIMMVVFWVLVIWLIIWLVRGGSVHGHHLSSSALDILKERYAKGEMNKEEFEAKKKDLM